MGDITPTGYISLRDAVRRLAGIKDYAEEDDKWLDIGDRLDDATAIHDATQELRQLLCDGELTGYYLQNANNFPIVPRETWTDDDACLSSFGAYPGFENLFDFHADGIKLNDARHRVFLYEASFNKFLSGEAKPMKPHIPPELRKSGRPKNSSPFKDEDEEFLRLMAPLIEQGIPISKAADSVVAETRNLVRGVKTTTKDESVSTRLQRKWRQSREPSSD